MRLNSLFPSGCMAIEPEALELLQVLLDAHCRGGEVPAGILASLGAGRAAEDLGQGLPSLGIVRIHGPILSRPSLFSRVFGFPTAEEIRNAVLRFAADPSIQGIVLDVDSPGGEVPGIPEAAAAVRAARDRKPVIAVANPRAASAAYWIASNARELLVMPSGDVGSIGIIWLHEDLTAALDKEGIKVTVLTAGRFKGEGSPFLPLSEEARGGFQSRINAYHAGFIEDVAAGRRVRESRVRSEFGEGRMVLGPSAVARGMADRLGTLGDALEAVSGRGGRGSGASASAALDAAGDRLEASFRALRQRLEEKS